MPRLVLLAFTIASLTAFAAGVVDAVPLVFWGSDTERMLVDHGRTVMLAGTGATLVGAAALATLRAPRAAALVAGAPLLPVGLAIVADGTAFGLLALWPALAVGVWGAFIGCVPAAERARRGPSLALGLGLPLLVAAAGAVEAAIVAAGAVLVAYLLARVAGTAPGRAAGTLLSATGYACVTAIAVFAGGTLVT